MNWRPWPRSLLGQMLLSVALALLVAQGLATVLLYRAQEERREMAMLNSVAFRLLAQTGQDVNGGRTPWFDRSDHGPPPHHMRGLRMETSTTNPLRSGERRDARREVALATILNGQGLNAHAIAVTTRRAGSDPYTMARLAGRPRFHEGPPLSERTLLVAAVQLENGGTWQIVRLWLPPREIRAFGSLILQTLVLYIVLVGGMALLLRRITRPLAALTRRVEQFARRQGTDGQLEPEGPDDVRRLIEAHNDMESAITRLLDEKDVMLGAIGHDLKTPLAALRVRIESVSDDRQRARMAQSIEDITRSLDDILSLARVGRSNDPPERTELSALAAAVAEEFEDMGQPVELAGMARIVLPLRATWLRRALRNLIENALRYAGQARVSIETRGALAVIAVEDDGPGIAEGEIAAMFEPFVRGDPSRNKGTGGAGLGLTLARAIAEQHGGSLHLENRATGGLRAEIRLPLDPGQ